MQRRIGDVVERDGRFYVFQGMAAQGSALVAKLVPLEESVRAAHLDATAEELQALIERRKLTSGGEVTGPVRVTP